MNARAPAAAFGRRAEAIALALLVVKGYQILARRYLAPGGEVDLIARKDGAIVFIEVKARARMEMAQSAITEEKRRRISRAARVWLSRSRHTQGFVLRGDAIFIAPWRLPRHFVAAFALDLRGQ